MLYQFKSPNSAPVIMLGAHGDEVLRAMGRTPQRQGILQAADAPALLAALDAAIQQDDELRAARQAQAEEAGEAELPGTPEVSLRQRAWPLREVLVRAQADGDDVVWGG